MAAKRGEITHLRSRASALNQKFPSGSLALRKGDAQRLDNLGEGRRKRRPTSTRKKHEPAGDVGRGRDNAQKARRAAVAEMPARRAARKKRVERDRKRRKRGEKEGKAEIAGRGEVSSARMNEIFILAVAFLSCSSALPPRRLLLRRKMFIPLRRKPPNKTASHLDVFTRLLAIPDE